MNKTYHGDNDDKEVLFKEGIMTVFADGTYTCNHWQKGDYSKWKIIDGLMHHKHRYDKDFSAQEGSEQRDSATARKIIAAIDEKFEKEVLLGKS